MTDFIRIFNNIIPFIIVAVEESEIPDDMGVGKLANILFWIARAVVVAVGGGVGIVKIVKGKSDENPRDTYDGLAILGAAGVIFAATFAIQAIF